MTRPCDTDVAPLSTRLWRALRAQESFLVRFWTAFVPLLLIALLIAALR